MPVGVVEHSKRIHCHKVESPKEPEIDNTEQKQACGHLRNDRCRAAGIHRVCCLEKCLKRRDEQDGTDDSPSGDGCREEYSARTDEQGERNDVQCLLPNESDCRTEFNRCRQWHIDIRRKRINDIYNRRGRCER